MGTALTPEQAEKLRRLTERVVVCYDGDAAGRAATRARALPSPRAGVPRLGSPASRRGGPTRRPRGRGRGGLAARIDEAPD